MEHIVNIQEILADIKRRLLGLKANRPVRMNQVRILEQTFTHSVTLAPSAIAIFKVTINCAGAPIADIGYGGFASVGTGIIPSLTNWSTSGNTAIATCDLTNTSSLSDTRIIDITAYAINGLSASIVRIA